MIILPQKKDESLSFYINYQPLNAVMKKDVYPLPHIEECLDTLNGCRYFHVMDLASGYWQVAMDLTVSCSTHKGLFEWNVIPFSLCNVPLTFCRLMEFILADSCCQKCLVCLYHIVAIGDTFSTAWANLQVLLVWLWGAHLNFKPK